MGLLLALGACGGDNPSTPPSTVPTTTTTLPAGVVLAQDSAQVPVDQFYTLNLTTTQSGRFEITVDWQSADSAIDLFLSDSLCTRQDYVKDTCSYLAKSLFVRDRSKPRTLTASGVPAGIHTFVIENGGPRAETLSFRISFAAASSAKGSLELGTRSVGPHR